MTSGGGSQAGWVYFIAAPSLGAIKIGWTAGTVLSRFRACQTYCPAPIELVAEAPAYRVEEDDIHEAMAESHLHREWFEDGPAIWNLLTREAESRPDDVVGVFPAWLRAAERDRERMERRMACRATLARKAEQATAQRMLF